MANAKPIERIYVIVHSGFSKAGIAIETRSTPQIKKRDLDLLVRYQRVMEKAAASGNLVVLVDPVIGSRVKGFEQRRQLLEPRGMLLLGNNFVKVPWSTMQAAGALAPEIKQFLEFHSFAPKVTIIGAGEYLESCVRTEVANLGEALRQLKPGVRTQLMVDSRHGKFSNAYLGERSSGGVRYKKQLQATPRRPRRPRPR